MDYMQGRNEGEITTNDAKSTNRAKVTTRRVIGENEPKLTSRESLVKYTDDLIDSERPKTSTSRSTRNDGRKKHGLIKTDMSDFKKKILGAMSTTNQHVEEQK